MSKDAFVVKAPLDLLLTWVELAEVVPDAATESVEDMTGEVAEILMVAVPSSTVK